MKKLPILLTLLGALLGVPALAQELPRPSMARQDQSNPNPLPTEYNLKAGPVLFNFTASVQGEYVDNIGLVNSGAQSDFLITPEVGIQAQWPVTELNTLTFNTSLGYTKYLIHSQFDQSQIVVSPDSALSFDVYTGDFKINFHDAFSYQQDPVDEAELSNVVNFDRFQNDVGAGVLWDLNKVILTLNYDHINFICTDLQTNTGAYVPDAGALSFTADQVSASGELHVSSTLIGGVEAAASDRTYTQFSGDYTQLSAGPYVKLQITDYIKAQLSGGFQYIDSPQNNFADLSQAGIYGPGYGSGHDSGYYFNLTLDHEVNKYFLQRLSLGHELELGLVAEESDVSYINYSASWHVNSHLNLALTLGYQDVTEEGGVIDAASFDYFTGALQANFPVTKSISGSVLYNFSNKSADIADQSYTQNSIGFILTYHF